MLTLTEKFNKDIQQNHSTVYPLIIIDKEYYISTIKEVIKSGDDSFIFEDYGLKISNIKESIDIQSHSFKISNVTLTLNNYEQNGLRLSDTLSDKINKPVEVYYKTQSCQTLEDCLLAYKGIIKRNTHDHSTLIITLEDLTDTKLHKEVPIANLGFSENTFSKDYINRSIPITYGVVEKAPVIPFIDTVGSSGKTSLSIIADDVNIVTGSGRDISIENFDSLNEIPELKFEIEPNNESFLYIYKGDYYRVLQEYNDNVEVSQESVENALYSDKKQYSINDTGQFISIDKVFTGGFPQNPPAANEFQTVKMLRPNQTEVLISESGEVEQGNVGSIINIEPDSGILRPEAAIDSNENPTVFFNKGHQSEFTTFAQIPNNQPTAESTEFEEGEVVVNLFTNYNENNSRKGILYPQQEDTLLVAQTNYIWLINAWIQSNAHHLTVKFISAPSGDMIVTRAEEKLVEIGLKNAGQGLIFNCYDTEEDKVEIHPQYALSSGFRDAWINSCSGVTGEENVSNIYYYFPENVSETLHPINASPAFINNSGIFANPEKNTIYPTTVYKIKCNIEHLNNNPNSFNPQTGVNENPIQTVYVGQWNDTMEGALADGEIWINLFYDEEYLDKDFLFIKEDFATFTPFEIRDKHLDNNKNYVLGTRYGARYNTIPIATEAGSAITESATKIKHEYFAGGYGQYTQANNKIYMDGLCADDTISGGNSGGLSWWMLIEDEIPSNQVLTNQDDSNYLGEFIDENCNTTVKKGTLIPCGGKVSAQHTGRNFNYDYDYAFSYSTVNLTTGNATGVAEQRLSLLFPIPDIESQDAVQGETNTFVYGALNLNIPEEEGSNLTHNTSADDDILVQAYGTERIDENDVNYNAEFVGDNDDATNLIDIKGNDDVFTSGGDVNWDVNTFNIGVNDLNNQHLDFTNFRLQSWDTPDAFDSLSLVYRIRNANNAIDRRTKISTNIKSIALLQYTLFENVFKDDLYADVFGRYDEDGTYTNEPETLIENPADVLYHFVEKELESLNITDRESWSIAKASNDDIKLGFSVKEKINSKSLIKNIAKNTKLFPKFNSNGDFSFSTIKNIYSQEDEIIKQSDIIKFQFTRTPSENIKTLVNVKYMKDYAEDEYKRETGYCDGYDFFGNSEGGREVYKNGEWTNNGYDYSKLGLERENNIFEFESDFIRDYESAVTLRNYIYLFNCNQHTIVKCTLPLKYIKLEVGDVVKFDKLNNNVKAFGEDYTVENIRNGQLIYPYFIITSATKSSKDIKLECMQLHELKGNFNAGQGSLSRRSELGIDFYTLNYDVDGNIIGAQPTLANSHITLEDIDIFEDIIIGSNKYLTSKQKILSDLTNDGSVDQYDLNILQIIFNDSTGIIGDINKDGQVNVSDVVAIINYIIEDDGVNEIIGADLNESGQVNVADVVALINNILGE